jgi:hypothetical protein
MAAPTEPPLIACSLTADAAAARTADWRSLLSRAQISRARTRHRVRVELRPLPGVLSELERLVAAERECCPFLTITVGTGDSGLLVLELTAPEGAAPIMEQLVAGGG